MLSKLWKILDPWKQGRLKTGYQVLTLWSRWKCDLHIVKIPADVEVPWHVDPVAGHKHYRLNLGINETYRIKYMDIGYPVKKYFFGMVTYFRPDLRMHRVSKRGALSKVTKPTYLISLGWVTKH